MVSWHLTRLTDTYQEIHRLTKWFKAMRCLVCRCGTPKTGLWHEVDGT